MKKNLELSNLKSETLKILLKKATIVDPNSKHNGTVKDVMIENGVIAKIGDSLKADTGTTVIEEKNLHASPGLFDMHASFREPGHEYKEDLESGVNAAAAGGYTGVALMPDTHPPVDNKAAVEFVINRTKGKAVDVYPCGTLSHQLEGLELAEMYDMHTAGAIAFTDHKKSVNTAGLLYRAQLYAANFGGLVMTFAQDESISPNWQMHEGIMSTSIGLKGLPAISEAIRIKRDLSVTEYNEGVLHFSTISAAESIALIKSAKEKGLRISCDVAAHHLLLNDESLHDFDSNYKVSPPLRGEEDRLALIEGIKNGVIDAICSDHQPEDVENKRCEYEHAAFGMIGLQTAFSAALTALQGVLSLEEIIQKMAINPRTILKLDVPIVNEGFAANLVLYNPEEEWVFEKKDILSKSQNSPFLGKTFKGRVKGIINNSIIS